MVVLRYTKISRKIDFTSALHGVSRCTAYISSKMILGSPIDCINYDDKIKTVSVNDLCSIYDIFQPVTVVPTPCDTPAIKWDPICHSQETSKASQ